MGKEKIYNIIGRIIGIIIGSVCAIPILIYREVKRRKDESKTIKRMDETR